MYPTTDRFEIKMLERIEATPAQIGMTIVPGIPPIDQRTKPRADAMERPSLLRQMKHLRKVTDNHSERLCGGNISRFRTIPLVILLRPEPVEDRLSGERRAIQPSYGPISRRDC